MAAAVEQRETFTPELLRVLAELAADPVTAAEAAGKAAIAQRYTLLPQFVVHLLAQFREPRAYLPLVQILRAPGPTPLVLFGHTITEGMHQILASVYHGSPAPLQELIEDEALHQYVRSAALRTVVTLAHTGRLPRAEVAAYFRSLFHGKLPRTFSYVWTHLARSVMDLREPALLPEVREAFANELLELTDADLDFFERSALTTNPPDRNQFRLIDDAASEMRWWGCFNPAKNVRPPQPFPPAPRVPYYAHPPTPPAKPRIGRNDPCPCGSGKKYKKCCG